MSKNSTKLFAGYCHDLITDPTINFAQIIGSKGISEDIRSGFYHSYSVVCFASQLALWLGAKNIYLYGCEFDYTKGRFFKENDPLPYDSSYNHIEEILTQLSTILRNRGGNLHVVGESRLTGSFGYKPIKNINSIAI